jgi:cytosolic carboxypeptidase protein 2/3
MKEKRHFITAHKEFEPLSDQVVPSFLLDEYLRNDQERAMMGPGQYPVVYDCIEPSPFYEDSTDPYIDDRDAIELPPVTE